MSDAFLDDYRARFPRSASLAVRARTLLPDGVTHDLRHMTPFPISIDRQMGAKKWDVDGNEFVDYWAGHGSMILGHSHPDVVEAVQKQMARSTHAGGCHAGEIEWAELVQKLVPSAHKMRFTGSGTEATLMALRLCRMFTGRPKFLKFSGHFHGWHDFVAPSSDPPYDRHDVVGIPAEVSANTVAVAPNDPARLEAVLKSDPGIGAVILEPTGGHWGAVPIRGEFLRQVRELTAKYGQILIFDEVITGFRVAPGGAQEHYGVMPDLTTLAKILAGGLPGGCLVGRADILDQIESRPGQPKMRHPGTYNANPLSAAAGIAVLKHVATGEPTRRANETAMHLRNRFNEMTAKRGYPWLAYGDFSIFRLLMDYTGPRPGPASTPGDGFIPYGGDLNRLDGPRDLKRVHAFRRGMLLEGIDIPGMGGWLTVAHTHEDIERTVVAADRVLGVLEHGH